MTQCPACGEEMEREYPEDNLRLGWEKCHNPRCPRWNQ